MRVWKPASRRLTRPTTFAVCLLLFFALAASPAIAKKKGSSTKKKQTAPGKGVLLVPPEYRKDRSYPVLVAMPYTGGSAKNFLEFYLFSEFRPRLSMTRKWGNTLKKWHRDVNTRVTYSYFLFVPQGRGSPRDHSERGFASAIWRYEKQIWDGLKEKVKKYPIDLKRVFLAGHSLGGDLSWAMSLRSPQRYSGAFISGSRTSYWVDGRLPRLARHKTRFVFSMGELEEAVRLRGLQHTLYKLKKAGVKYRYIRPRGLAHRPPRKPNLFFSLERLVFNKSSLDKGKGKGRKNKKKLKKRKGETAGLPWVTPGGAGLPPAPHPLELAWLGHRPEPALAR